MDYDPRYIRLNQLLALDNPDCNVKFVCADIADFMRDVKENEYDLVLCFSVLHWLTPSLGFQVVQELVTNLSAKIDTGIFEFALSSEYPDRNLPRDYHDFLQGYPFIKVLSRYEAAQRPFCFASNRYVYFEELGLLKIDSYEVHRTVDALRTSFFPCGDKFVKIFYAKDGDMQTFYKAQREVELLADFNGKNGLPKPYLFTSEQDETGIRAFIVRDLIAGITLRELIESGEDFDRWEVIRQALQWQVLFEDNGYYHGDFNENNIIYGDDKKVYPIDYEGLRALPEEITDWGYAYIKLTFFRVMNRILEPQTYEGFTYPRIPKYYFKMNYLVRLKKHLTPRQYERIAAIRDDEKFFARLYEILFQEEKDACIYNMTELEIMAIEQHIIDIGKQLDQYNTGIEKIAELIDVVNEQQRHIEQLERIINERLK